MTSPRLLAFAVLLGASTLLAQGVRCTMLGGHHQHGAYCDVTGFVAPNGREYALLAATTGIAVIDCSQPAAPVERAFFASGPAVTRDVETFGSFAYAVCGNSPGLQVIDLTDADHPQDAGVVGGQYFLSCSSLCIDRANGHIYCVGTNAGVVVFDASSCADSPVYVGTWLDGAAANVVQEMAVANGVGFAAMPGRGQLRLLDPTSWPPAPLGSAMTPGARPSRVAASASGELCASTDAGVGGGLQLFDASNPLAPSARGWFSPHPASIPGSVGLLGDYCHLAWHSEGYRCVDVHDPEHPVEVASYDTWPGPAGGSSGAVGCYPFLPSGNVFLADSATGLYVLRPQLSHLTLAHTPLGPQASETVGYLVQAQVDARALVVAVSLTWQVDNELPVTVPMALVGPNEFGLSIPAQLAPSSVRYHIVASDGVAQRRLPAVGEHRFVVGAVRQVFVDGFETAGGWTHGALAGVDEWQIGAVQGRFGVSGGLGWADPPSAFAGSCVAGTDLGGPAGDGAYADLSSSWLQSPSIPTGGAQRLHLRYRRWLTLAAGDSARLLVNGRVVSSTSAAVADAGWQLLDHDLSSIANAASSLSIRFELNSDAATVAGGFNLDDVEVYWLSDQLPPGRYGSGTAGSGGFVPDLELEGDWHLGATADVRAGGLLGGGLCALLVGVAPASIPLLGITGLVNPNGVGPLLCSASGAPGLRGGGSASFLLPIPGDPRLDNVHVYTQVLGFDIGAPGGLLSCSGGMHFRICAY